MSTANPNFSHADRTVKRALRRGSASPRKCKACPNKARCFPDKLYLVCGGQ